MTGCGGERTPFKMNPPPDMVPQTYGEAVAIWGTAVIDCPGHEWDNRTTAENRDWLVQRVASLVVDLEAARQEVVRLNGAALLGRTP